ncbi:importin-5-like [Xenia sp. Carnegie-2017]|uniref:importin-5-like n=1 Tax=Xenia sp. Carnegie-2017 TaxID=2897299 RepID=UPI001F050337|nr:importin-5-like [Xenia sp. Carnegie-2017]
MLWQSMQDQSSTQVRFIAARAAVAFLVDQVLEQQQKQFVDIVPGVMQALEDSIQEQDDNVLKSVVDLAEKAPKVLRSSLEVLLNLMLRTVSNTDYDDNIRQLSLECIITLSESASAMLRKYQKFFPLIVPQVLAMMVDIEDDPEWNASDDADDEDCDSNAVAGESALDRFACGIGGKHILPHIIATVPQMLQNDDWRYRHAGLMAISAVGEGCHKQMLNMLASLVDNIIPFLNDAHPRVRYAACNALGQLSTDFAENFQQKFHSKVLPGLIHVLDDAENPRVQAHAGAALVNFCEECPKHIMLLYLERILQKVDIVLQARLQDLIKNGKKLVLEQIITTLATVADTAEEKFLTFYDRFMPTLKYVVENAVSKDLRLLRGKTIECISLIGLAVGHDKFLQDCNDVMQLLLKTQTEMENIEPDDPQLSYLISAWARMCKILGKRFTEYLPMVMPPVLKVASIKPEVALLDADDPKNETYSEKEGWEFVSLGDQQRFGIRTAGLEDKSTACQMLVCYARELKSDFADYAEEVVKIMVPLLKFYFNDVVRSAAADSLPLLLECVKIKGDGYVRQMWGYLWSELLKAVSTEPEPEVKVLLMESCARCIETLGNKFVSDIFFEKLSKVIHDLLVEHRKRHDERIERRKDEDYDEEVEEDLRDEDLTYELILRKVSDIMHSIFGCHKEDTLPLFEKLINDFYALLHSNSATDRQWSLCIFDDLIEHTGPVSFKYKDYFLRQMLDSIVHRTTDVRQAAAYGIGVMAQFGGKNYSPTFLEALPLLYEVVNDPKAKLPENIDATENAISAVTKICKYNHGNVAVDEIIPIWLSWLPIVEDKEEAPHVYGYLCDLIQSNHPIVLGENYSNFVCVLRIFAAAFESDVLANDVEIKYRMKLILKQAQMSPELWSSCFTNMNETEQQILLKVVNE